MQQPGAMFRIMPSFPHTNITTEQIQKYLDENKKLILAILDNQNLGKLAECAQYQAQLQKNLMYLAAIADGQPQTPTMTPQTTLHPAMQQGTFYMQQHPQAAAMTPQPGMFPQRAPFNSPHSVQDSHQHLHQQANQGQTPPRPVGPSNGANQTPQNDANLGVGSGNKQDKGEASSEWHGKSGVANGREAK